MSLSSEVMGNVLVGEGISTEHSILNPGCLYPVRRESPRAQRAVLLAVRVCFRNSRTIL